MNRTSYTFAIFLVAGMIISVFAGSANAQTRNERETRDLVRSLSSKVDDLEYSLTYRLRSSSAESDQMDRVSEDIETLRDGIRDFDDNFRLKRENRSDVRSIITAAGKVHGFLTDNPQNRRVEDDWNAVKSLVERLAQSYGVSPDWNSDMTGNSTARPDPMVYERTSPPVLTRTPTNAASHRLTGTYHIDLTRSDKAEQVIDGLSITNGQRFDLLAKLEAPEQVAINITGNQVTFASTKNDPITFVADGSEKSETDATGRSIRTRATIKGDELVISSIGGQTDYTIIFAPEGDGQKLKVTRRFTAGYLQETLFADSIYDRSDASARLGIEAVVNAPAPGTYSSNDPNDRGTTYGGVPAATTARTGDFIVPDGTVIIASLDNMIDTKVSQNNDRFRMIVQSPDEFRGATIEGYLTGVGRSGQVSGRSNISFNFERITLRDGRSYEFAGSLEGIKDHEGKTIKVDTEGTAKGDSQTKETVKRGGIGAGIGAVIGAIAGGAKGAAIGAIIGGGAGAGSVAVMGRDDIQLMQGSTITIRASAPSGARQSKNVN
ncbi:MAG: hypothetical protein WBD22_15255 [Pyrinomonadaceae bacterium]